MADHFRILRCPDDDSEEPEVHKRGFTTRASANQYAFEKNSEDDGYRYWPEIVKEDGPLSLAP